MSSTRDDADDAVIALYVAVIAMNAFCLLTIFVFPQIFKLSSLSRIITSIHVYDILTGIVAVSTQKTKSGSFGCILNSYFVNATHLSSIFWVSYLAINLSIVVQPKQVKGAFQSELWEYLGTNLSAHLAVFCFGLVLTVVSLSRFNMKLTGTYCWIDEDAISEGEYIVWNILLIEIWCALGLCVSFIYSIQAIWIIHRIVGVPQKVKNRFYWFLVYPISNFLFAAGVLFYFGARLADYDTRAIPSIVIAASTLGSSIGFFFLFRSSLYAWRLLLLDFVRGTTGTAAAYLETIYKPHDSAESDAEFQRLTRNLNDQYVTEFDPNASLDLDLEKTSNPLNNHQLDKRVSGLFRHRAEVMNVSDVNGISVIEVEMA
jgi:hypothetical protein